MTHVFRRTHKELITAMIITLAPACDLGFEPADHTVTGTASGIVEPVTARLDHPGGSETVVIPADGRFGFETLLAEGDQYTVSLLGSPPCATDAASGVVGADGADEVKLVCEGVLYLSDLTVAGVEGFFQSSPLRTEYEVGVSLLRESTSIRTVSAHSDEVHIEVAGAPVASGEESAPIRLDLGENRVSIRVWHDLGLERVYELDIERALAIAQSAYVKASNSDAFDEFGSSVALSGSGDYLAVGAWAEGSAAAEIGGDEYNEDAPQSGAVYVFARCGGSWVQQAYIKADNAGALDAFGGSVALSATGDRLAVGARRESSAASGVDGDGSDDSAPWSGAVYVFSRGGERWSQEAYLKADSPRIGDLFGTSVAMTNGGDLLAVGASGADDARGAVYLFSRTGADWQQQARLGADNGDAGDEFGHSVALSDTTLAVGAWSEDSAARGVHGNGGAGSDDDAPQSGAVYVYARAGEDWRQQAYIKADNGDAGDYFGTSVALSGSGDTLAVGAWGEASGDRGIERDGDDNSAPGCGAVYVLSRVGADWHQEAYIGAGNAGAGDWFGSSVALSDSGDTLAVGARFESSAATGVDGDAENDDAPSSGAAYLLTRSGPGWQELAYLKASNTGSGDLFGHGVALSGLGDTAAVAAWGEAGAATGVNGYQASDAAPYSGAVYLFH